MNGKLGRPSVCTPELLDEILERYRNGEMLSKICQDDHIPTRTTIYDWIDPKSDRFNKIFSDNFYKAQEVSGHLHHEKAISTLEDLNDMMLSGHIDKDFAKPLVQLRCKIADRYCKIAGLYNKRYNDRLEQQQAQENVEVEI